MTRGHELTLLAEKRRIIDGEEHRHRRLINSDRLQGLRILQVAEGIANLKFFQSDDSTDVTAVDTIGAYMPHALEGMQLFDLRLLHRTVTMSDGQLHAVLELSAMHTSHGDATLIARIVERGDEHLWCALNLLRSGDNFDDFI